MAHLIFIAKGRDVGMYRLTGRERLGRALTVGRDVQCDIFVPDVFVSRRHCALEPLEGGEWAVMDSRSRNGIHFGGRRVFRRVLRHGDTIEIGSVAFQFDESDLPESLSGPAPFGRGTSIASLVDTVFADGLRPRDFIRRNQKKPVWEIEKEEALAARRAMAELAEREARELAERLDFSEPAELDVELQIDAAQSGPGPDGLGLRPQYVLTLADWAMPSAEAAPLPTPAAADFQGDRDRATVGLEELLSTGANAASANTPAVTAESAAKRVNLWAEAEGAAKNAEESAAEGKRPRKKATGSSPDSRAIGQSFLNFVNNLRGGYSLGELWDGIAASPYRSAGVGAAIAAAIIVASAVYLRRPAYKSPPRFNTDGSMNRAYIQGPGD